MSLKYRLIILGVVVLAVTFAAGTVLGVYGSRRLVESQLRRRLQRGARDLAASGAPLNEPVLARFAPLLDAEVVVLTDAGEMIAHSGAHWPWERLAGSLRQVPSGAESLLEGGRRYYFATAAGRLPATGGPVTVVLLADERAVREPIRTTLYLYLISLAVTTVLLSAGMYLVGLGLVRRIARLGRRIDATFPGEPAGAARTGDELDRLSAAFDDLLQRLQRSRRRLLAQQQLATTGKIASSVAHEVRNPLQAMRLTVEMLNESFTGESRRGCEVILSEIDRLSLLTDELLMLAGKDTRRLEPVEISRALRETVRLLQYQLRQREIRTEIDLPALPAVRMDRNRCRQLLLNLLLNAVEASPAGRCVRVSGEATGRSVTVRIADGGPGFPQQVLADRAEEFFSTKTSGAGLGLSICRRIVAEANGRLKLYNTPAGAVAEVTLPVGDAADAAEGGNSPAPGRGAGSDQP